MIKPYYEQDGITIYHGDCREILPQLRQPVCPDCGSTDWRRNYPLDKFDYICHECGNNYNNFKVDLVLADPPYGIGEAAGKNKSRGLLATPTDFGNWDWDNKPIHQDEIDELIYSARYSIIWGGNFYKLPSSSCWLVWDKDNGTTDFADCELAWTNLPMAVRRLKWRWNGMLQENMANKEIRLHPTQKPLPVIKWCITQADKCGENNLILDPFLGSGTTAVAAKILGRRCIGIEIEEKYCEIAVKRLAQSVMRLE